MPTTIASLASELGVHQMRVRQWLRRNRPRPNAEKWSRYELSEADLTAVREAFAAQAAAAAIPPEDRDWFWEGNIQTRIARYLEMNGWTIEHTSNTVTRARGDDIRARMNDRVLRVEVKGWPSEDYANPSRASEKKRTRPSTQAGHWYSQALLRAIRDLGRHPTDLAAIGLPDWPRFRMLLADTEEPLQRLGIGLSFVTEDGKVEVTLPPAARRADCHGRAAPSRATRPHGLRPARPQRERHDLRASLGHGAEHRVPQRCGRRCEEWTDCIG